MARKKPKPMKPKKADPELEQAKAEMARRAAANRARRTCLSGIGEPHSFVSQHAGHRICNDCRPQLEYRARTMGRVYHCYAAGMYEESPNPEEL